MTESKQKLIYIYMPAVSKKNFGGNSKSEIRKAWLKAMQIEFPQYTEQTHILKEKKSELAGYGLLHGSGDKLPVLIAGFNKPAGAQKFLKQLRESEVQKHYDDIAPRIYRYSGFWE